MNVKFENNEDHTIQTLTMELPYEEYSNDLLRIIDSYKQKAKVPGFRAGRVPPKMILEQYRKNINDDLIIFLSSKILDEIDKHTKDHLTMPIVNKMEFGFDSPLVATITYEIRPEFELPDLSQIKLFLEPAIIDETVIDNIIKTVVAHSAFVMEAPEDHVIQDGDVVTFSYTLWCGGKSISLKKEDLKDHVLEINSGRKRGLDTSTYLGLRTIGHKKNDEIEVIEHMDKNHKNRSIADKDVVFKIKIKKIEVKEIPELSDEQVKSMGLNGIDTLEGLRNALRKDEIRKKEIENEQKVSRQLMAEIVDRLGDLKIPNETYQIELSKVLDSFNLSKEDIDNYSKGTADKFVVDYVNQAQKIARFQILQQLILSKVIADENLTVTEEEVNNFIKMLSKSYDEDLDTLLKEFKNQDSRKKFITKQALENKAFDLLQNRVKVTKITEEEYLAQKEKELRVLMDKMTALQDIAKRRLESQSVDPDSDEEHYHSHPHVEGEVHEHAHGHSHRHSHDHTHENGETHSHEHDHTHDHAHSHGHSHGHEHGPDAHEHKHLHEHDHEHSENELTDHDHSHEQATNRGRRNIPIRDHYGSGEEHEHDHGHDHGHDHHDHDHGHDHNDGQDPGHGPDEDGSSDPQN
jgi:trigger factor